MNDTAAALEAIAAYFRRFVICTDDHYTALALWTAHTYVYEAFDATPYLIITSAEKRSGKTRVFECLQPVIREPLLVASLTEAVLFRAVHAWKPSLLIDETDTIFKAKKGELSERQEMIRAVLNAGYRRSGTAIRCAPNGEPEKFNCYCPKALAGIGHLPDTVRDRGLSMRLHRRTRDEPIERFRHRTGETDGTKIANQLAAWAPGARILIGNTDPVMPDALDDRAQDSYEVLIAISDLAGGEWPERARTALVRLRQLEQGEQDSFGGTLLADIKLFADRLASMGHIATLDLLALLYEEGEAPWSEWWGEQSGKRAARRLAMLLKEYDCEPEQFWSNGKKRGYKVEAIMGALARYGGSNTVDTVDPSVDAGLSGEQHGRNGGESYRVESGDLQGSTVSTVLNASQGGGTGFDVSRSLTDWIGQASLDDLHKGLSEDTS